MDPILTSIAGGLAGSLITAIASLGAWQHNRRLEIEKETAEQINLLRDLNHLKRNIEAHAQAFEIIKKEQEKQSKLLLKIAATIKPDLIDEIP